MRTIKEYISEAQDNVTTLYFNSLSACLLFDYEVLGQISDGYWENSRPANHWKWVSNIEIVVDPDHELGYEGPTHRLNYSCKWITRELGKSLKGTNDDYSWLMRAMNYCRAGLVLDESKAAHYTDYKNYRDAFRNIIEHLPEEETTVEEFEKTLRDYQMKYWDKVKDVLDANFFKKYYSAQYTFKDFRIDVMDVEETINTKLG